MRKLSSFGTKNNTDNTALIQSAIDSRETIYVDPGIWIVDGPLKYDESIKFFGDGPKVCEIRGTANIGERAMFTRRQVWLKYTGVAGAPHTWELDGVPSAIELGTGVLVQMQGIHFRSFSPSNACFELYNSAIANYHKDCWFTYKFRGLNSVSAFNSVVDGCRFNGENRVLWLNTDKADQAWGLSIVGHGTVRNCVFTDCSLGMECHAGGCILKQLQFVRCVKGLKISSVYTHPDLVNNNTVVTSSDMSSMVFTDCLRSIHSLRLGSSEIRNVRMSSYNAPQLDGRTTGLPEYGIKNDATWNLATAKNMLIKGTYSVGATTGTSIGYTAETAA